MYIYILAPISIYLLLSISLISIIYLIYLVDTYTYVSI